MISGIQNPTLYVFIGSVEKDEMIAEVKKTHASGEAMYLHLNETTEMDKIIRTAKAELQAWETRLSLQSVNIYVIVKAHETHVSELVKTAGNRLRVLFAEDFTFQITLAVFLRESNEPDEDSYTFEERGKATYKFLTALTGYTDFDCIFLLSDRNEYGRVSVANRKNIHKLMAYLPYLHCVDSDFYKTLGRKAREMGRVLFASAGVGVGQDMQLNAVNNNKINLQLHNLAQILEDEFNSKTPMSSANIIDICDRPDIANNIASVAARPLSPLDFKGLTLKEAEWLLFEDGAAEFFATIPITSMVEKPPSNLPLRKLIEENDYLKHMLVVLAEKISFATVELEGKESIELGAIKFVHNVKNEIGQCYAVKYKLAALQSVYTKLLDRQLEISAYIEYISDVIAALKSLPMTPIYEETLESLLSRAKTQAALNISLLRDDGLVREMHVLKSMPDASDVYVLNLIGGFVLEDLTRYHAMQMLGQNLHIK